MEIFWKAAVLFCVAMLSTHQGKLLFADDAKCETDPAGQLDPGRAQKLFDAMEKKLIEVKFVPVDSTWANVLITNQTQQEITLSLPARFGAVHVLAQFGGGLGGAGGGFGAGGGGLGGGGLGGGGLGGGGLGGGGGQGLGGGFGGGGLGGGGLGGGGLGGG
ncbi:MAG: hypothetical protein ABI557_20505, partial [Aureliella sp.]